MPDQSNEFLKDYQAFAQQSWDTWMRHLQQPGGASPLHPFAASFTPSAPPADDLLTRSLASLKTYGTWLQQMAGTSAGLGAPNGIWQAPPSTLDLQSFMGAFTSPFAQNVANLDSASAFGLDHQWQSWLQAMQRAGGMGGMQNQMATFGITREMQLDQQALATAMSEYMQINARYQGLLQKVNTQGVAKLQQMLEQRMEPGKQIESMKALYDLWVDAMEEAYAEIALSDEFRDVFGSLVNAQMKVRKLQQQQTEQMCRELGIPTRGEVDSLGRRMQQLRRDLHARGPVESQAKSSEVETLQAEISALKRALAESKADAKVRPISSKPGATSSSKTTAVPRAKSTRSASGKRK